MRSHDLRRAIRALDVRDVASVEELTQRVKDEALEAPRTLVHILQEGRQEERKSAAMVLLGLEETAFLPVLESRREGSAQDYLWEMQTLVDIQLQNRAKLVERLNAMLLDTRPVPIQESPMPQEEQAPPRRVCDEAYLMLRSLLAFEDEESSFASEDAFLAEMSEEERDEEIARIKKSSEWVNLVETYLM